MKKLYINNLFFLLLGIIAVVYVFAFFFPFVMWVAHAGLLLLVLLTCIDVLFYSGKNGVKSNRILPEKLSNGDENFTKIDLRNNYPFTIKAKVIDEIPFQFQLRNFEIHKDIKPYGNTLFEYPLLPKERENTSSEILIYTFVLH